MRLSEVLSLSEIQGDGNLFRRQSVGNDSGVALSYNTYTVSAVLGTLWPTVVVAVVWLILFIILRRRFPRLYSARSYGGTLPEWQRTQAIPLTLFSWIPQFFKIPDTHVLHSQSLDAFLLLRLIRVATISCFVCCLITWPILFPVNIIGPGTGTGFNIFNYAHAAAASDQSTYYRYYAHAVCAYLVFGFLMWMIHRESRYCYQIRQAFLSAPDQGDLVSSRTVLYLNVPKEYQDERIIRKLFGESNVRCIWIPRETNDLEEKVGERNDVAMKLEQAEINIVKQANHNFLSPPKQADAENTGGSNIIKRPTHRLKPLIGEKVDTIEWARNELKRLNPEVESSQRAYKKDIDARALGCVFVEFIGQREAQSALQSVTHHDPGRMTPRYTSVHPEDIVWGNLDINQHSRSLRYLVYVATMAALVIAWSIPVTAIATVSRISYLENKFSWLHWLTFVERLPTGIRGIIPGLLPTLLLTIVMSVLPLILRLAARLSGEISHSEIEYTVQNTYFAFQVTQVFLVTTLSSGVFAAIKEITNSPAATITLLAQSLPQSSTFYLCYFIVQGVGVVAGNLTNLFSFFLFYGLGAFDKTPRARFNRWMDLNNPNLGTTYPVYTNLFVIAICYACIAPLVVGFAVIGLSLFWVAMKYDYLFVYNVPHDTKGRMYARALQQLFVGLYLAALCMIGLFALDLGSDSSAGRTLGPLILVVILLVFTILFHLYINQRLHPLMHYLPTTVMEERRAHAPVDDTVYLHPSVTSLPPLLWIPKDKAGASKEEIKESTGIIGMTDEGAYLDEKNKLQWVNEDAMTAPLYVEKPRY